MPRNYPDFTYKQKNSYKSLIKVIHYLFWFLIILYTDPGGVIEAFDARDIWGKVDMNDLLFVLISFCYILIPKNYNKLDKDFQTITICLILFLLYYFIFNIWIIPILNSQESYSLLNALIKSRHNLYYFLLFTYIYEFFKTRVDIFTRLFTFTSAAVIIVFLFQLIIGADILPIFILNRGFIDINRNIMMSEGIIFLIIPMGIVSYVFKTNLNYKKILLLGFALSPLYYIVALKRKELISILIYFILAILLYVYITKEHKIIFTSGLKAGFILIIVTTGSYLIYPKYTEAAKTSFVESYNVLIYGRTSTGERDERLALTRPFIVNQFLDHPLFGTGFDNRWKSSVGQQQGYESSDYPLLAAFARYGITGVLIAMPVYIFLIRILIQDIKTLKKNKPKVNSLTILFFIVFILFFAFHLVQYFNWFCAFSSNVFYYWFFFLAFYLAARYRYYFFQITYTKCRVIEPTSLPAST